MISVIVPAHNEELVIARGLRAIVNGAAAGELEVIVACNGCTDRTADIAREFRSPVRVLDIPVASQIEALNAADEVATGFPRFYVDADVVLDIVSIRQIASALSEERVQFATPTLKMDLSETSWIIRAYYRVWTSLPYNTGCGAIGTGVYALSRHGRSRFGCFPAVIADDGYVRAIFSPAERVTVPDAVVTVSPPRTLDGFIKIHTRGRLGCFDLRSQFPKLQSLDKKDAGSLVAFALRRPDLWPSFVPYLLLNLLVRRRALSQLRAGTQTWERDISSRV